MGLRPHAREGSTDEVVPQHLQGERLSPKPKNSVCGLEKNGLRGKRLPRTAGTRSVEAEFDAATLSFRLAGKDGEKSAGYVWCFLHLSLGKSQCFSLAFHTRVTLRASWYAPPDTGVSDLQLVALEQFPSIEGAGRISWSAPLQGGF